MVVTYRVTELSSVKLGQVTQLSTVQVALQRKPERVAVQVMLEHWLCIHAATNAR